MLQRPDTKLICSPPNKTAAVWPLVEPMIKAAFAASDLDPPIDLVAQLREGKRLLWLIVDIDGASIIAAGMTALYPLRSGKMCKILECGGERPRLWIHHLSEIEAYAKAEGCDRVMIEGRAGWARMFQDYRTTGVILEKRI